MHSLTQLQKQQVGIRLPKYLLEQVDGLAHEHNLNRTDIIIESIKSYLDKQEVIELYKNFDNGCKQLKDILDNPEKINNLQTLDNFLDEI